MDDLLKLNGKNILGYKYSALSKELMEAKSPGTQERLDGQFAVATSEELDEAMNLATTAFETYKHSSGQQRADFLNAIADEILKLGNVLIQRAMKESGLPEGRITGERGRTVGQLRLFAEVAKEGSWVEASIDKALPDRTPFPKADIRKMLVPVGPVVVFTASNFPLAFSTAGGDTASALAAGNPVIVKAHESHLGTNALVAFAIQTAAQKTGMPDGVFSSLNGYGPDLGQNLVRHPLVKSVAFTGSARAGKALYDAAAQREEPIPVFAEMGSVNPVFILPSVLAKNSQALATQYAGSVALGVGQFCTNPGLILVKESEDANQFIKELAEAINGTAPATMLSSNVCNGYYETRSKVTQVAGVKMEGMVDGDGTDLKGRAAVASVDGTTFLKNAELLQSEVFGPFTLVIKSSNDEELIAIAKKLHGQLTSTIMGEDADIQSNQKLVSVLQEKVGRLIFNGVPTGVEVCHSMHHGGPFPASTDGRFTSVGSAAIKRFARPLAFQNWPQVNLPAELQDGNPNGIWRHVDGVWENGGFEQA